MDRNSLSRKFVRSRKVALRKESVDRNSWAATLPAIERVALRKESVDRNQVDQHLLDLGLGRSPQGERG